MQASYSTNRKFVSVIILTYNNKNDLAECLKSINYQTFNDYEIIVVDNASTDGTPLFIKTQYPDITLIETGKNLGYPAGNNIGFEYAKGDIIVIVNPDTVADVNWLSELTKPLYENPEISITTSKILTYHKKNNINTCANHTHFTGLDFCRGLNEPSSSYDTPEEVGTISGCSFAVRREVFESLSGFDPDFFLYLEDVDFSWRARLAGYKILYVPTSIIWHKYKLSIAPWKGYYLERNRYAMLLKNFSKKMIVKIMPGIIVTEIVTWGHAILNGIPYMQNKIRAYWWVLTNIQKIREKRRIVQSTRKINDKDFISMLEWKIPFEQVINNQTMRNIAFIGFNSIYKINYEMIKK